MSNRFAKYSLLAVSIPIVFIGILIANAFGVFYIRKNTHSIRDDSLDWVKSEEYATYRKRIIEINPKRKSQMYLYYSSINGKKKDKLQAIDALGGHTFGVILPENPKRQGLLIRVRGKYKENIFIEDSRSQKSVLVLSGWEMNDFQDPTSWDYLFMQPSKDYCYTFADLQWTSDGRYILFRTAAWNIYVFDPFPVLEKTGSPIYGFIDSDSGDINIDRATVYSKPIRASILHMPEKLNVPLTVTTKHFLEERLFECFPDESVLRGNHTNWTSGEIEEQKQQWFKAAQEDNILIK